ncbi:hypothetical protein [Amycolatopsis sp. NPDC003731]
MATLSAQGTRWPAAAAGVDFQRRLMGAADGGGFAAARSGG